MHWRVQVPDGDVLIHCGDSLGRGNMHELEDFVAWFAAKPHKHKLMIAGNHDWIFERNLAAGRRAVESNGITFLHNESTVIDGVRFYGSPYTPVFYNWAFMCDRGPEIAAKWAMIPDKTDVLITHGPPYGHGDLAPGRRIVGCLELLQRVREIRPMLHCFGHIHEGYGTTRSDEFETVFINAAICDERYKPNRRPIVMDIEPTTSANSVGVA